MVHTVLKALFLGSLVDFCRTKTHAELSFSAVVSDNSDDHLAGVTMREVRWEQMFPDELEQAFQQSPVVYLPYGICEPHGPHNALGLDGLKAHGICCSAARAHGGIVAPVDYWHIHECGGYAIWASQRIG